MMTPDETVAEAFVALSDVLVDDIDVAEFLQLLAQRCARLLDVPVACVMVADEDGMLRLLAASSENAGVLDLFEVDAAPCAVSYTTGQPVSDPDLAAPDPRWTGFGARARAAGFRAAHALPMRLRRETIGVLYLFHYRAGLLDRENMRVAQALANMGTVGLLQQRPAAHRRVVAEQLQHVLNGRVLIEQARGVLAERLGIDVDAALDELRRHAKRTERSLSATAAVIVHGDHVAASNGVAPPRDPVLLIRRFDIGILPRLRALLVDRLAVAGLDEPELNYMLLGVHEALANAIRHGGGTGRLWLWRHADTLWGEISDDGPGLPPGFTIPSSPPGNDVSSRGLWLLTRMCPGTEITNTFPGVRVLIPHPLAAPVPRQP
jgi:hypothetical protein